MKTIPLTQNKFAIVDNTDFPLLSKYKWYAYRNKNNFYAGRKFSVNGKRKAIPMHAFIMNTPKGYDTDHKDGNGLNNQKNNLRICSHSENVRNRGKGKNNTSGFKGVSWNLRIKKWMSSIRFNKKKIHLGYFNNKIDAYQAYIKASVKYHREFANQN